MNGSCYLALVVLLSATGGTPAFQPSLKIIGHVIKQQKNPPRHQLHASDNEYRNAPTKVLSNFMSKKELESIIDFDCPKIPKVSLETLAQALDASLYESEWFVTGKVEPRYFSDNFKFQDPDVKVSGIQQYAIGVYTVFNQETARAEIISTEVSPSRANTITCTWRLSGRVDIGPGLEIKPYIVETDFTIDPETGLIILQEDRFAIPQWDILLSALFPFLIGKVTSPPAPKPSPRIPPPPMPKALAKTS